MIRMLPSEYDDAALAELLPDAPTREQIEELGRSLQANEHELGVVDLGTVHHFADRLYGRSVRIAAGTLAVGLPYKQGALIVSIGDITVWTEGKRQRLTGAHVLSTPQGSMRAVYAHADTSWLTAQANLTGSTDLAIIEDALIENSHLLLDRRTQRLLS